MKEYLVLILQKCGIEITPNITLAVIMLIIFVTLIILHFILFGIVLKYIKKVNSVKPNFATGALLDFNLFSRIAMVLQGVVVYWQATLWLDKKSIVFEILSTVSFVWIAFFSLLSFYSVIDKIFKVAYNKTNNAFFAMQTVVQSIKLIFGIICAIYIISILADKSPVAILSGLGAMSAVLMLVFKDTILGFTAGLQLSSNQMVQVGDWIEMPKYNADGDVIDIGLNVVKVKNWDKTITTIPTYALVSDSFKNWRGMRESGGRRIKRSIIIDVHSVRFLSDEDIERLKKANLLHEYLEEKKSEIEKYNQECGADLTLGINGRRLTNLGTLRNYLVHYLRQNDRINQGMTIMVRQLSQNQFGIPLEIYCFTATIAWVDYENIQSDIFDHTYSILNDFGLKSNQVQ